jgi:hypothetical protein
MAATAPPTIRRRPGVLVAGAVVATARSRPPPSRPHPQPPRQLRLVSRCRPPPGARPHGEQRSRAGAATHHAAASRRLRLHLPQGPPHPTRHRGQLDYAHVAIDNCGQVVGQYVDAAGVLYGYLWEQGRGFRTIDTPLRAGNVCAEVPDVGRVCGTVAADINDRGEILLPALGGRYKGRPPSIPPTIGG